MAKTRRECKRFIAAVWQIPGLSHRAKVATLGIMAFFNRRTELCYPGHRKIAGVCGMERKTVERAIADLDRGKIFKIQYGNLDRNASNHYTPNWKLSPTKVSPLSNLFGTEEETDNGDKTVGDGNGRVVKSVDNRNGDTSGKERRQNGLANGDKSVSLTGEPVNQGTESAPNTAPDALATAPDGATRALAEKAIENLVAEGMTEADAKNEIETLRTDNFIYENDDGTQYLDQNDYRTALRKIIACPSRTVAWCRLNAFDDAAQFADCPDIGKKAEKFLEDLEERQANGATVNWREIADRFERCLDDPESFFDE